MKPRNKGSVNTRKIKKQERQWFENPASLVFKTTREVSLTRFTPNNSHFLHPEMIEKKNNLLVGQQGASEVSIMDESRCFNKGVVFFSRRGNLSYFEYLR